MDNSFVVKYTVKVLHLRLDYQVSLIGIFYFTILEFTLFLVEHYCFVKLKIYMQHELLQEIVNNIISKLLSKAGRHYRGYLMLI